MALLEAHDFAEGKGRPWLFAKRHRGNDHLKAFAAVAGESAARCVGTVAVYGM